MGERGRRALAWAGAALGVCITLACAGLGGKPPGPECAVDYWYYREPMASPGRPAAEMAGIERVCFEWEDGRMVALTEWSSADTVRGRATITWPDAGGWVLAHTDAYGVQDRTITLAPDDRISTRYRNGSTKWGACAWSQRVFDDLGRTVEERCLGADGRSQIDSDGCAIERHTLDEDGLPAVSRCFDESGAPATFSSGNHATAYERDDLGRVVRVTALDLADQPLVGEGLCSSRATVWDESGHAVESWCQDENGKPKGAAGAAAGSRSRYDASGCKAETVYLDVDGNRVSLRGIHRVAWERDERCGTTRYSLHDEQGELAETSGPSLLESRLDDQGRIIERQCFVPGGIPASCDRSSSQGDDAASIQRFVYDQRGNLVEKRGFDAGGNPVPLDVGGTPTSLYEYDDAGHITAVVYADAVARPTPRADGIAREETAYDALGAVVSSKSFGPHGEPVAPSFGCHEVRIEFDAEHRLRRNSCFGTDGNLAASTGMSRRTAQSGWVAQSWPRGAAILEVEREGAVAVANRFLGPDGSEIEVVDCRDYSVVCSR